MERAGLVLTIEQGQNRARGHLGWNGRQPRNTAPFPSCEIVWQEEQTIALPGGCIDLITVTIQVDVALFPLLTELTRLLRPGGSLSIILRGVSENQKSILTWLVDRQYTVAPHGSSSILARKSSQLLSTRSSTPKRQTHRDSGYALLKGVGLEIGAFNEPAPVPQARKITYFDAIDTPTATTLFPEIDAASFVKVEVVGDVDRDGLGVFSPNSFDFIICNHVIEHVANPVRLISIIYNLVKDHGYLVIAAPDKRFTFDHERDLTPFTHLWDDFKSGVTTNSDDHYIDFIKHVTPHLLLESAANQTAYVEHCRSRREHAHVWDSHSFRDFLQETFRRLSLSSAPVFESFGDDNHIEYFGIWKKSSH